MAPSKNCPVFLHYLTVSKRSQSGQRTQRSVQMRDRELGRTIGGLGWHFPLCSFQGLQLCSSRPGLVVMTSVWVGMWERRCKKGEGNA